MSRLSVLVVFVFALILAAVQTKGEQMLEMADFGEFVWVLRVM